MSALKPITIYEVAMEIYRNANQMSSFSSVTVTVDQLLALQAASFGSKTHVRAYRRAVRSNLV